MTLIYSSKFQPQPYVSWKGKSTNSVVPGNSRGGVNGFSDYSHDFIGPNFKARPIKHYRKKLSPNLNSGTSKATIKHAIDNPGGSVFLGTDDSKKCCDNNNTSINIKNLISTDKNTKLYINDNDKFFDTNDCNFGQDVPVCIACNPENNRIKSGVSLLNKKYYPDTKSYLQSRCKQYEQRIAISKRKENTYSDANGDFVWPSNSIYGSQVFNMQNCFKSCDVCPSSSERSITIYKPSNAKFATQGAVPSSLRSLNLKYNTVTKNASSFKSAIGSEAANAGKYHGGLFSPYLIKNKTAKCVNSSCINTAKPRTIYNKSTNQIFSRQRA